MQKRTTKMIAVEVKTHRLLKKYCQASGLKLQHVTGQAILAYLKGAK